MSEPTNRSTRSARRNRGRKSPPPWLLAALGVCVLLLVVLILVRSGTETGQAAEADPAPTVTLQPTPTPEPTPEPTPTPAPEPDWSQPVPEGTKVEMEWFSDAVFIGDSRTDGFKLYSGITGADFLDYTGITVFDVMDGKKVIRMNGEKVSVLDALTQKQYGKVYISLGVNELGYYNPEKFAETYGRFIDAIRESQPDAALYIQSIIPVNTGKCKANDIPSYVTNEGVVSYNAALAAMAAEKKVPLINVSEALVDETGEVPREDSADGVHFQKTGYVKWLKYLMTHTGA